MKLKKIAALAAAAVMLVNCSLSAGADGDGEIAIPANAEAITAQCTARSAVLYEARTGSEILGIEQDMTVPMSHTAKLMTVLITAEKIESGKLKLDDEVTVSAAANSQGGTQIWLDAGEKILVSELLKAITIGNANDACYALAEKTCGSAEEYIKTANDKAVSLGMDKTHFSDVTGMNESTVSTSADIAKLAAATSEYDFLTEYFCTWMEDVRGGKTQLVNTNRLVRSYNGITGMKACSSEASGNCLVATAERNGMELVCVIMGSQTQDTRFTEGKAMLDHGFSGYEIYCPEFSKEILSKVKVRNGAENYVKPAPERKAVLLIPKGTSSNITVAFEKENNVKAPVDKGQKLGVVRFVGPEGVVFETQLVADNKVDKMSFGMAFKRLWLNLLNLS